MCVHPRNSWRLACPKTERDVPSGVLTDEDNFAHLPHERVTVSCTVCSDIHEYWTSKARLAAEPSDTNLTRT
jgi:hypothetical protein